MLVNTVKNCLNVASSSPVMVLLHQHGRPLTTVKFIKLQHQRPGSRQCANSAYFFEKFTVERFEDLSVCLCE